MQLFVKGKGKITLDKKYFVSSGGEGAVYAKQGVAYKIYNDRKKMIPEAKIQELSTLNDSCIIKPENVLMDSKNKAIGYTMKYLQDTVSLCQVFTKSFKQRNAITTRCILSLVNKMRDTIQHCHTKKILIVDLNELNFLVSSIFTDIFFIDVDSYQTPSFPATAIMETIRDRHCNKKFNDNTDWFSFGVITFQMFIGIHPYKGKHQKYKSLDDRMLKNISVLNKEVSVPKAALPFKTIPDMYLKWYKAVFEKGERLPPPFDKDFIVTQVTQIETITGTDNFAISKIKELKENIINFKYISKKEIILTEKGLYVNGKFDSKVSSTSHIGVSPKFCSIIAADLIKNQIKLYNVTTGKNIEFNLKASKLMSIEDRLYVKNETTISEIQFTELANRLIAIPRLVCNILPNATQFFDGVVIQNLLDSYHISIFPEHSKHYQIKIKELANSRIINAKYRNHVLIVLVESKGKYNRWRIKFNDNFTIYEPALKENVGIIDINFVTLDNGVCVDIDENDYVNIFTNQLGDSRGKIIQDTTIAGTKLYKVGTQTVVIKHNKIYNLNLKGKK